jgi:transcription elongation factor GreB
VADDESGAPARSSTRYITPEGFDRLQAELDRLWKVERPRVTSQVAEAAALGDRSENAEYIYGKKRLREIDSRVHFLSKRLDELEVVRSAPDRQERVFFGAWVSLESDEGEALEFRIVGPDEFDPALRAISIESPMARAVLGKQEGDEVVVVRPKGRARFTILRVRYSAVEADT